MKDLSSVQNIINVLQEIFINPFSDSDLICISNGLATTDIVRDNLLNAVDYGKSAMQMFGKYLLEEGATVDFFEPMKMQNLKTFSHLTKTVNIHVKDREIPIKVHRNLFGQIAIIMQKRNIQFKVFAYPLGPLPWSLAGVMRELRKTSKVALVHKIEKAFVL